MSAPPLEDGLLEATEGGQSPGYNLGNPWGLHFILSVNNKRLQGYLCVTGMLPVSHILNVYLRKTAVSPADKIKAKENKCFSYRRGTDHLCTLIYPLSPPSQSS